MSGFFSPSLNIVRSPRQSSNTFSQFGAYPKQRNSFIVRFFTNNAANLGSLTFAIKSVDRPKVNITTETLNQYNKKRLVTTKYVLEPVKIQFYDSADNTAQNLWAAYSKYYFGDLNAKGRPEAPSYRYDATNPSLNDSGKGFGFTAGNGGNSDNDSQFFFNRIEIYHFYNDIFDLYQLKNPKITSFDLDALDYSSSEVSIVNASFMYENLDYFPQQKSTGGGEFPEFNDKFDGNPVIGSNAGNYTSPINPLNIIADVITTTKQISSLLANPSRLLNPVANYRYTSAVSSGPLSAFGGNWNYGPMGYPPQNSSIVEKGTWSTPPQNSVTPSNLPLNPGDTGGMSEFGGNSTTLTTMSLGNPQLSSALNIGNNGPTSNSGALLTPNQNISPSTIDIVNPVSSGSIINQNTSNVYNNGSNSLTTGILAGNAINGSLPTITNDGISLPYAAIGSINAQATGTSQIGVNSDFISPI